MRKSLIGWVILVVLAAVWEGLGIAGVDGVWPLTSLVRLGEARSEVGVVGVFLVVAGGGSWLLFHFLVERNPFKKGGGS